MSVRRWYSHAANCWSNVSSRLARRAAPAACVGSVSVKRGMDRGVCERGRLRRQRQRLSAKLACELAAQLLAHRRAEVRRLPPLAGAQRDLLERREVEAHHRRAVGRPPHRVQLLQLARGDLVLRALRGLVLVVLVVSWLLFLLLLPRLVVLLLPRLLLLTTTTPVCSIFTARSLVLVFAHSAPPTTTARLRLQAAAARLRLPARALVLVVVHHHLRRAGAAPAAGAWRS